MVYEVDESCAMIMKSYQIAPENESSDQGAVKKEAKEPKEQSQGEDKPFELKPGAIMVYKVDECGNLILQSNSMESAKESPNQNGDDVDEKEEVENVPEDDQVAVDDEKEEDKKVEEQNKDLD